MKTTISKKGQVTIPKPLRDRLGLLPGQVLDFEEEKGRLVGTGEFFSIEADQVFKAIGQHYDQSILEFDDSPAIENGRIRVDKNHRSSKFLGCFLRRPWWAFRLYPAGACKM